ncbi:MAG: hydrogenase iron-sulfur subunit [Bacillota bacterium]
MTEKNIEELKPKIIAYLCNWCSYAAADLAGSSRLQYPTNIRIVRIPCTGRLNPLMVIKTFRQGADGILVSGCHPGDCHYIDGNYYARRRFIMVKKLLEYSGVEEERLNFTWCSAAEGRRFAEVVTKVVDRVKKVGPWQGYVIEQEQKGGIIDEQFL